VEEVLELLYDCQGMITRLEIFNLRRIIPRARRGMLPRSAG
jgi:hypothetical protein